MLTLGLCGQGVQSATEEVSQVGLTATTTAKEPRGTRSTIIQKIEARPQGSMITTHSMAARRMTTNLSIPQFAAAPDENEALSDGEGEKHRQSKKKNGKTKKKGEIDQQQAEDKQKKRKRRKKKEESHKSENLEAVNQRETKEGTLTEGAIDKYKNESGGVCARLPSL